MPGPTNLEDLRTVDGGVVRVPYLRRLLISAMVYGGLADAKPIWEKFKGSFCEGLGHIIDNKGLYCDPNINRELDYGLFLIHTELLKEEGIMKARLC
ncbi:hypothetical protein V8E54_011173 [Elaphomyces granulatus]